MRTKIGEEDVCIKCGWTYIVESNSHRICGECKLKIDMEYDNFRNLRPFHAKKENSNPVRFKNRLIQRWTETNGERKPRTASPKFLIKRSPANILNLIGKRFGKLVVLERAGTTKRGNVLWKCICDCGNIAPPAMGTSLRRGEITSCGCSRLNMDIPRQKLNNDLTVDGVVIPLLTKKTRSDSVSGHKGIYVRNRKGRITYEANITVKGKRVYGKAKRTLEEAIEERRRLEEEYHKPYIDKLKDKE